MNVNKEDSMWRVAKFSKVSEKQFVKDWLEAFNCTEEDAIEVYNGIELPKRGTLYSAGYDFFAPYNIHLEPGAVIKIPTGIRAEMPPTCFLMIAARSGLGTKFGVCPRNEMAIIDADFFYAENEGHIAMVMVNNGDKPVDIDAGKGFCQGIFLPYYITVDDDAKEARSGGFGSTTK